MNATPNNEKKKNSEMAKKAEDATERSWDATALPPSSSQPPPPPAGEINRRRISTVELDTDEDFEDESFLDRRKFNVGSTAGETDAEEALALARAVRLHLSTVGLGLRRGGVGEVG